MSATNDQALRRNLARMLAAYAVDCAATQREAHRCRGRVARTFRYSPPPFHVDACRVLGYGTTHDVAQTIHAYELRAYVGTTTSSRDPS